MRKMSVHSNMKLIMMRMMVILIFELVLFCFVDAKKKKHFGGAREIKIHILIG